MSISLSDVVSAVFDPIGVADNVVSKGINTVRAFVSDPLGSLTKSIKNYLQYNFALLGIKDTTVYTTDIAIIKLVEDIPDDYIKTELIKAVLAKEDINSNLYTAILVSPKATINKVYAYGVLGETDPNAGYFFGLPTVRFSMPPAYQSRLKEIVEAYLEEPVTAIYSGIEDFVNGDNTAVNLWYKYLLVNFDSNYNLVDNTYTVVDGETTHIYYLYTYDFGTHRYVFKKDGLEEYYYVNTLVLLPQMGDFYTLVYTSNTFPRGNVFFYKKGYGIYPDLDMLDTTTTDVDEVTTILKPYPIIPLRYNFINYNSDTESKWYQDIVKLDSIYNLNLDLIFNEVTSNPDIDIISNAFLFNAIPINTVEQSNKLYCYMFFNTLYIYQENTKSMFEEHDSSSSEPDRNYYTLDEGIFNYSLSFYYIDIEELSGVIGSINTVNISVNYAAPTDIDTADANLLLTYGDELTRDESTVYRYNLINSEIVLDRQINDTTIRRITVRGANIAYIVPSLNPDLTNRHDVKNIQLVDGIENNGNFLLPLDKVILNDIAVIYTDSVVYESLHVVIMAADQTKLNYYQTSAFTNLVEVGTLVLTLYSILYGFNASSLTEFFKKALIQYALNQAYKQILKSAVSTDIKKVASIAYITLSYNNATGFGSEQIKQIFADKLLAVVKAITDSINIYVGIELEKVNNEITLTKAIYKTEQEALAEIKEGLNTTSNIDPLFIAKLPTKIETVDQFRYRTNMDTTSIAINSTSNYVNSMRDLDNLDTNVMRF